MTRTKWLSLAAFAACVVASNWLTAMFGMVGGFVTAGTFTAGLAVLARDWLRESAGKAWVFAGVGVGAVLSAAITYTAPAIPGGPSPLQLAAASAGAFTLALLADHFVYEPLRQAARMRAVAVSNTVGDIVDSVVFLLLAGFPIWPQSASQTVVKWVVGVGLPWLIWMVGRAVLRHTVLA